MSKTPVMLSALVCPGLGQFMQGRKKAGALFLILILISFASVMTFFIKIMISFYRLGFDLNSDPGNIILSFAGMAVSFIAAIVVYLFSLVDTVRAGKAPPPIQGNQPD